MNDSGPSRQQHIARYKTILRGYVDQRPSGIRQRIAHVLGTHKSFISQITNPADPTPIPARHLQAIIDVCHLAPPEQERFLDAYGAAHPQRWPAPGKRRRHYKTLHLQVPLLQDAERQRALEAYIRDSVRRLCSLMSEELEEESQ